MLKTDFLLIAACLTGALLAGLSLFQKQSLFPGDTGAIARVNDVEISETLYQRVITGMQNQKRTPLLEQDFLHVRDKLIDEELLIQRGQELGFLQQHAGVRREMLQAVIESIVAENRSQTINEKELRDFFENKQEYFSQNTLLKVRRLQFETQQKAQAALLALKQEQSFESVAHDFAQETLTNVPEVLLGPTQLRQYSSSETIKQLNILQALHYSDVIYENQSWFIYQILEKIPNQSTSFESIKPLVEQAYLRERDEKSIQLYLEWLKKRADISAKSPEQLEKYLINVQ